MWMREYPDECAGVYVQFPLPHVAPATITQALLELTGASIAQRPEEPQILHVYGVLEDTWRESEIAWASVPSLDDPLDKDGDGKMASIPDNFVRHGRNDALIQGHCTVVAAEPRTYMLDVTDFIREQTDDRATFMILREVRYDGDIADGATVRFASKEGGAGVSPKLVLFTK